MKTYHGNKPSIAWIKNGKTADGTRLDGSTLVGNIVLGEQVNLPNKILEENAACPEEPALKRQVGGGHYKHFPIQPVEFIQKNGLNFLEGCILKRLCRYPVKDGLKDLRKMQHEVELLIAFQYPERNK